MFAIGSAPLDVLLHNSFGICIVQPVHACMKVASVLEFRGFVSVVSVALI